MNFSSPLFTIKVPPTVGLSDQIWHLDKLYRLGKALSYTYVHSPFRCPRSYHSSGWERIGFYLKKILFSIQEGDGLIKFMGLDKLTPNLNDLPFRNYQKITIDIDQVFQDNLTINLIKLNQYIEQQSSDKKVIYVFYSKGLYQFTSQIDSLINLDESQGIAQQLNFADHYWKIRKKMPIDLPFKPKKIKILLHIRKGDTACIKLKNKTVYTHGSLAKIANSYEELGGHFRKPIDEQDYHLILNQIIERYGDNKFSILVISDGYNKAFRTIILACLKGIIRLTFQELISLIKLRKQYNQQFTRFLDYSNTEILIGESNQNLLKSIHAAVCADIIILGSSGFPYWVHYTFKQPNRPSVVSFIDSFDKDTLLSIE